MNNILAKRICKLIAVHKALSEDYVWQLFTETNSIDKVLETIEEAENRSNLRF